MEAFHEFLSVVLKSVLQFNSHPSFLFFPYETQRVVITMAMSLKLEQGLYEATLM